MKRSFSERLSQELDAARASDRFRSLRPYAGVDFGSNDYLGLSERDDLRRTVLREAEHLALSASSSRLLPGNHQLHLEVEREFAEYIEAEAALFFNSGYDANFTLMTTLPTRHDVILYDERVHASLHEGIHASLAQSYRFRHNDLIDLRRVSSKVLREYPAAQLFVVTESVFSMDGDLAPLGDILVAADEADAMLIIDEAHGTGVLGPAGKGGAAAAISRSSSLITVHTCGKALGAAGAFVASTELVKRYLINKARPFIYTTALPPIVPATLRRVIALLRTEGDELVSALRERSNAVREALDQALTRWHVAEETAYSTPIIPVIIGSEGEALAASRYLEAAGYIVPAVRPPTVPSGTSRLRLNISLRHSTVDLHGVVRAIAKAEQYVTKGAVECKA